MSFSDYINNPPSNTIITYLNDNNEELTATIEITSGVLTQNDITGYGRIKYIDIGLDVASVGAMACWGLPVEKVTIPDSVSSLGVMAFGMCLNLADLAIPSSLISCEGLAFDAAESLTNIIFQDGTTTILNNMFSYCTGLKNINLPSTLTSINTAAFMQCWSLTSVVIPASVSSIEYGAFCGCTSLTSFTVDKHNSIYKTIDNSIYTKDETTLVAYPLGLSSIVIPSTVTAITPYIFGGHLSNLNITFNQSIENIIPIQNKYWDLVPNTVINCNTGSIIVGWDGSGTVNHPETIVEYNDGTISSYNITGSFTGGKQEIINNAIVGPQIPNMGNATKLIIGSNCTSITGGAFSSSLTSIFIPDSIISMGGMWVFERLKSSCKIIFNGTASTFRSRSFGNYGAAPTGTHIYCTDNVIIVNQKSGENIVSYNDISNLTYVKYTDNTVLAYNIENEIVDRNSILSINNVIDISAGNSISSIGNGIFSGCASLTSITLPNSISSIGHAAFYYCYSLTSIVIPEFVEVINEYAFSGCSSLTSVNIPNYVSSINYKAFDYCTSLKELSLPNSLILINTDAFSQCYSLTSLVIPETVKSIGTGAFASCSSLTSLTLPSSLTSIGNTAFNNCPANCQITFNKTMSEVSSMSDKYWGINTGARITCTDGTILVTGYSSELFENPLIPNALTSTLKTQFIFRHDTSANWLSSNYIARMGEPIVISNSLGRDLVIGNGTSPVSSLTSQAIMYKLSSSLSSRDNTISNRVNTISSSYSTLSTNYYYLSSNYQQLSTTLSNVQTAGFTTWEGDAGFYNERFYNFENATLNVGNNRIHGVSSLTFDAVSQDQYGKVIRVPWEVASNNNKTNMLLGKTWIGDRGLGQIPYCQPLMPTDSDFPNSPIVIPNLEGSYIYWSGVLLNSYEVQPGVTSALAIQMPWDDVSAYGSVISAPTPTGNKYLKATKLASQHWVSGLMQQTLSGYAHLSVNNVFVGANVFNNTSALNIANKTLIRGDIGYGVLKTQSLTGDKPQIAIKPTNNGSKDTLVAIEVQDNNGNPQKTWTMPSTSGTLALQSQLPVIRIRKWED